MDKTLADILEQLTQAIKQQSAPTSTATQPAQNITLPDIHPFSTENAEEFEEWLERFQFALDCAVANMADEAKVKLLMTKLNPSAFGEYKRYCLPEEITKFNFADTKSRLIKLFSHPNYDLTCTEMYDLLISSPKLLKMIMGGEKYNI